MICGAFALSRASVKGLATLWGGAETCGAPFAFQEVPDTFTMPWIRTYSVKRRLTRFSLLIADVASTFLKGNTMPIITCPSCQKQLKVKDELAGKKVRCPGCQGIISIPTDEEPPLENPPVDPPSVPNVAPEVRSVDKAKEMAEQGKVLAQRGKAELAKGARNVMAGLSAAKAGVQARLKLNTLNAELIAAYRAVGDAAYKAGWGGEAIDAIRNQKMEVATITGQYNKSVADAELAKNTPGAGAAKQAVAAAQAQKKLADGVLDGLQEKLGHTIIDDASAPADIGEEQRTEIARLHDEIKKCEEIIETGKKGLLSKLMIVAGAIAILIICIAFGFLSFSKGESIVDPEEDISCRIVRRLGAIEIGMTHDRIQRIVQSTGRGVKCKGSTHGDDNQSGVCIWSIPRHYLSATFERGRLTEGAAACHYAKGMCPD